MPIYVYEVVSDGEPGGERFEIYQSMNDPPLTRHPETGAVVRRVLQAPNIGGKWSDRAMHRRTSDDTKLERLGFTKYVKAGDGHYEKRAGEGPKVISRDKPVNPKDL